MVRPIRLITPISIHALRKESDRDRQVQDRQHHISIHALRKESDPHDCKPIKDTKYFNPRSP